MGLGGIICAAGEKESGRAGIFAFGVTRIKSAGFQSGSERDSFELKHFDRVTPIAEMCDRSGGVIQRDNIFLKFFRER